MLDNQAKDNYNFYQSRLRCASVPYFYPHFTKRSPGPWWMSCPREYSRQGKAVSLRQGTDLLNIAGEKIGCSGTLGLKRKALFSKALFVKILCSYPKKSKISQIILYKNREFCFSSYLTFLTLFARSTVCAPFLSEGILWENRRSRHRRRTWVRQRVRAAIEKDIL